MSELYRLSLLVPAASKNWLVEVLMSFELGGVEEQTGDARDTLRLVVYGESQRLEMIEAFARKSLRAKGWACLSSAIEFVDPEWELKWTEALVPVQLTSTLTLVPQRPTGERNVGCIYVTPAMAFGFGEHPTTRLIAPWLEQRVKARGACRVLDMGCGTGVLSFVAASSGCREALGVDTSDVALIAARENARLNQVNNRCSFVPVLAEDVAPFEIAVVNIELGGILATASTVAAVVAAGADVAVTGLMVSQQQDVIDCYNQLGVQLHFVMQEEGWGLLEGSKTTKC